MAKSWREVRAEAVARGRVDEARVSRHRTRLEAAVRAHRLAEVRKAHGVSQKGIAAAMGVSQPRISKIERGDIANSELGTLRSYVEALGGTLRVVADFGDEQFVVGGSDIVRGSDDVDAVVDEDQPTATIRPGSRRHAQQRTDDVYSVPEE